MATETQADQGLTSFRWTEGEPVPSAARRAEINEIGRQLGSIREVGEDAVRFAFAAHGPSSDCRNGFTSVTIEAGKECETASAVSLVDALYLARAKVQESAARRAKESAKAKAQVPA